MKTEAYPSLRENKTSELGKGRARTGSCGTATVLVTLAVLSQASAYPSAPSFQDAHWHPAYHVREFPSLAIRAAAQTGRYWEGGTHPEQLHQIQMDCYDIGPWAEP